MFQLKSTGCKTEENINITIMSKPREHLQATSKRPESSQKISKLASIKCPLLAFAGGRTRHTHLKKFHLANAGRQVSKVSRIAVS